MSHQAQNTESRIVCHVVMGSRRYGRDNDESDTDRRGVYLAPPELRCGEPPQAEVDAWRKELHHDFENALAETKLPERLDYEVANRLLIKVRSKVAETSFQIQSQ